jgi:hypothetical protein
VKSELGDIETRRESGDGTTEANEVIEESGKRRGVKWGQIVADR